jgi:pimeloyl-ACP methyl ester carboxylesterase
VKASVRGIELFFDVDGPKLAPDGPWMRDRPTVVLLHSGPGIDHTFYKDHVGPALAESAQVVYLDLRGSGRSDWSEPEHWTPDAWVEDVREFLELLEIERPVVLGTAFGGSIALLLAARHPEAVDRLVLVSTIARYVPARAIAVLDRLGGPEAGEIAARYFADPSQATFADFLRVCVPLYTRNPLPPDAIARIQMNFELIMAWERGAARQLDLREEAARVTCPTLVLAGEDDPSTTIAGAEELVAALPQGLARFERYADTGHGVFRDRPEAIELVREFLAPAEPS